MDRDPKKVGEVGLPKRDILEREIESLSLSDAGVVVQKIGNGRIGLNRAKEGGSEHSSREYKQGDLQPGFQGDGASQFSPWNTGSMPVNGRHAVNRPLGRVHLDEEKRMLQETSSNGGDSDMLELASSSDPDDEDDRGRDTDSVVESPGESSPIPMEGGKENAVGHAGSDPADR